jgi:transcriptional regulator with XRE-family HTH domain
MSTELDTVRLSRMLNDKRGKKGLRVTAEEIGGVSASTLSRVEQGKVPDVDTFIKICKWLGVSTDEFIAGHKSLDERSTQDIISYHLRADKELNKKTMVMLQEVIKMAFTARP